MEKKTEDKEIVEKFVEYELDRYEQTIGFDHLHAIGEDIGEIKEAFERLFRT